MANYKYPRVTVNKTLITKRNITPYKEDTTVLFVPFVADKGPSGEIKKIYSLTEFTSTYGELDYAKYGQTALNIANWLAYGGTVYAYRLVESAAVAKIQEGTMDATTKKYPVEIVAKYAGAYYNNLKVKFTADAQVQGLFTLSISVGSEVVETFQKDTLKGLTNSVNKVSEYIYIESLKNDSKIIDDTKGEETELTVKSANQVSTSTASFEDMLYNFWTSKDKIWTSSSGTLEEGTSKNIESNRASYVLSNRLETPVDMILDAGYCSDVKNAMAKFLKDRQDIIGIFDCYCATKDPSGKYNGLNNYTQHTWDSAETLGVTDSKNMAVYEQYFTIEYNKENIYVTPTYFLSQLIPYNDKTYGIQWPTAGLRRGVLNGVIKLNTNPNPDKKEQWFNNRINYVERTSREVAFMSQRTYDGSSDQNFTALSFLNNTRVTAKIVKELERMGREYLFEFNDAITLSQMSSVLNKYLSEWIANRTLSLATVDVAPSPYSENAVDITLYIRFTGTIEVITIDITIE